MQAAVPDEVDRDRCQIDRVGGSGHVDAMFTTGGTGIAARDVTPEATRRSLTVRFQASRNGCVLKGCEKTPLAVLSRGVAGTRGKMCDRELAGISKGRARIAR